MYNFRTESFSPGAPVGGLIELAPSIATRGFIMGFAANEEIFGQLEPADFVYKVVEGVVRTSVVLTDGRRQIEAFHFPGDVFGLENGADHAQTAEAVEDCRIALVKRPGLERAIAQDSAAARDLWVLAAQDLQDLRDHMLLLGRKGAVERVAAWACSTASWYGRGSMRAQTCPFRTVVL